MNSIDLNLVALEKDLPNFPLEVLEDWLLPYAKSDGWPPKLSANPFEQGKITDRWRYLLSEKSLSFWRSVIWKKCEQHVSIHDIEPEGRHTICQMLLGAVRNEENFYTAGIQNLKPRFNRIKDYLLEHGTFPKPPTLLVSANGFKIMDGNHRMAAYFYASGDFPLEPEIALLLKTEKIQSYWIGRITS